MANKTLKFKKFFSDFLTIFQFSGFFSLKMAENGQKYSFIKFSIFYIRFRLHGFFSDFLIPTSWFPDLRRPHRHLRRGWQLQAEIKSIYIFMALLSHNHSKQSIWVEYWVSSWEASKYHTPIIHEREFFGEELYQPPNSTNHELCKIWKKENRVFGNYFGKKILNFSFNFSDQDSARK